MSVEVRQLQSRLSQLERRGAASIEVAACRHDLAMALQDAGRLAEAEQQFVTAHNEFAGSMGSGHAFTISCRLNLALVVWDRGRAAEAEQLLDGVVQARTATVGPVHPLSINARGNLLDVIADQGRVKQALAGYRRLLADCERAYGPHSDAARGARIRIEQLSAGPRRSWWKR